MTDPAPSEQSELELKNEFQSIHEDSLKHANLLLKQKTTPLTEDELTFISSMPARYRRGVIITRILRRTNTGPAKVKEAKPRVSKKAKVEFDVSKIMEDI